jgi:hypothetical protein
MDDCADGRADSGKRGNQQNERAAGDDPDRPQPLDDLPWCAHAIDLVPAPTTRSSGQPRPAPPAP